MINEIASGIASKNISPKLLDEITNIVFEESQETPLLPCDVIFVFGGSHPGLWEWAAEAYFRGLGKNIIVTGGNKPNVKHHYTWKDGSTPEALVLRRELIRLHVPEDVIYFEDRSTNSLENVLYAHEVFDLNKVRRILAVCKNYGAGRQCRTLRKQVSENIKVVPYPFVTNAGSDGPVITRLNWMNHDQTRELVIREFIKIYTYGQLGHLEAVEDISSPLRELINVSK